MGAGLQLLTRSLLVAFLYFLVALRLGLSWLGPSWGQVKQGLVRTWSDILDSLVWAAVVALGLVHFVVRPYYIPTDSMAPTLAVNDFFLCNLFSYELTAPSRGEVIVFEPPPLYTGEKTDLIKRVAAIEFDTVAIEEGRLKVNGQEVTEPWLVEASLEDYGPERVRKGHLFVLGDNRNNSRDSRSFGQVPLSCVIGKAEILVFPRSRIRWLRP